MIARRRTADDRERRDREQLDAELRRAGRREDLSFFNKDAVWTKIPMKTPAVGIDAIRKALGSFGFTPQAVEFVIHNTAESPDTDVVVNERTDRFKTEKGWLAIRVMGAFELKNGKIQEWRDYFDLAEFQRQLS